MAVGCRARTVWLVYPMRSIVPLTPADIHNQIFSKPPLGKRGYDEEQVDALLDEVTQEMIRLLEENESLRQRADRAPAPPPAPAIGATESEFSAAAAELDRARQSYDQAERRAMDLRSRLEQAHRAAAAPPPKPVLSAENTQSVMALAQRTADDHLRDAQDQSHDLLLEAREQSEQLLREARTAGTTIETQARHHHRDAMAELQTRRTALLQEIQKLTELAESYYTALRSHLVSQEQHLTTPDTASV